jgi:hypothetical protein
MEERVLESLVGLNAGLGVIVQHLEDEGLELVPAPPYWSLLDHQSPLPGCHLVIDSPVSLRPSLGLLSIQLPPGPFSKNFSVRELEALSRTWAGGILSEGAFPDETLSYRSIHTSDLSRSDSVVVVLIVPLVLSPFLLV